MQHHPEFTNDIGLLANIFKDCRRRNGEFEDSSDDEIEVKSSVTPGSIGKQKKAKESIYKPLEPQKLTEEEFMKTQESLLEASREIAKYEITYRQAVGAEDVFLQMGCRTPATSSCEDMIMTIHLPGEERTAVDLNVNHTNISLTSPKYKLQIPFPQPIDPQCSSAKWDPDTEKLTLTLRMNREFDFVNF